MGLTGRIVMDWNLTVDPTGRIVTDSQPYSGSDWSYRYGLSALQWVQLVISLRTVNLTVGPTGRTVSLTVGWSYLLTVNLTVDPTGHIITHSQPYSGSDWSYRYRLSALQWV